MRFAAETEKHQKTVVEVIYSEKRLNIERRVDS
jgi:hypothetical protein